MSEYRILYRSSLKDTPEIVRDRPDRVNPTANEFIDVYQIRDPVLRVYIRYLYDRRRQYELYGENADADLIEPE